MVCQGDHHDLHQKAALLAAFRTRPTEFLHAVSRIRERWSFCKTSWLSLFLTSSVPSSKLAMWLLGEQEGTGHDMTHELPNCLCCFRFRMLSGVGVGSEGSLPTSLVHECQRYASYAMQKY